MRSPRVALGAMLSALLLLTACGGEGDEPAEEMAPEAQVAEDLEPAEEPEADETEQDPSERPDLYYPASELFLPDHPIDGLLVDFYATIRTQDETVDWFERNVDDIDAFTIEDETVGGERRWVASRDAADGEVARIEVAHSSAHAEIGLIAPIADSLPPDTVIIAIARPS